VRQRFLYGGPPDQESAPQIIESAPFRGKEAECIAENAAHRTLKTISIAGAAEIASSQISESELFVMKDSPFGTQFGAKGFRDKLPQLMEACNWK
jgi:hypothetical protein